MIGNTIAIAVAIDSVGYTITITISMALADMSARHFVCNATGYKCADGDQCYRKLFQFCSPG